MDQEILSRFSKVKVLFIPVYLKSVWMLIHWNKDVLKLLHTILMASSNKSLIIFNSYVPIIIVPNTGNRCPKVHNLNDEIQHMTFMALKIYFPAVRTSCQQCSHIAIPCLNISPDHHTLLHILESYHKLLYQHSLIHCSVLHISCSYAHIISKLSLQTGGFMTFSKLYPYLRTNQIIYLPMVSSTSKHKPHYDNSTRLHTKTLAMCIYNLILIVWPYPTRSIQTPKNKKTILKIEHQRLQVSTSYLNGSHKGVVRIPKLT